MYNINWYHIYTDLDRVDANFQADFFFAKESSNHDSNLTKRMIIEEETEQNGQPESKDKDPIKKVSEHTHAKYQVLEEEAGTISAMQNVYV